MLMSEPSGTDVMQYALSKLGGASGYIWLFSTHALVLDTVLTSSHAIYTTWRQLWPTCSRLNFNPTGLHVCAITSHICAGFHPSKTVQQNTFLISSFPSQISCSCLAVLKTWTHVALSWLKVIIKSKYAADSCVLVKIFPRTSQECNH